jgi:hypothetical protein
LIGTLTVTIDPAIDAESAPSTRAVRREEINQKPIGDASTDAGRLCVCGYCSTAFLSERVDRLVQPKHEHLIRERQTSTPQGATWNKGR